MKRLTPHLGHGLLILALACTCARAAGQDLYLQTADGHAIPRYQALADSTAALSHDAATLCQAPDDDTLARVRSGFQVAMDHWQSIEHLRFGPVEFQQRRHRFALWPDRRGSVGRHLAQLLEKADPAALEPQAFAQASVAVQGFSALERLLFEPGVTAASFGGDAAGRYRCAVIDAITHNLSEMSAGVVRDWVHGERPFRQLLLTAETGNTFFADRAAADGLLLNNLYTQLQVVLEQKIGLPLGTAPERAQPKRAESWRSGRSLRNIRLNLRGCEDLYRATFATRLGNATLAARIDVGFAAALAAVDALGTPLEEAVAEPEGRSRVMVMRDAILRLAEPFAAGVPESLGVSLGFNSLDGD